MTSNYNDCNTRMVAPAIGNYNSGRACTPAVQARECPIPILRSKEGVCPTVSTVSTDIKTVAASARRLPRTNPCPEIKTHSDHVRYRCRERIPYLAAHSAAPC